jgi:hypothetical protein
MPRISKIEIELNKFVPIVTKTLNGTKGFTLSEPIDYLDSCLSNTYYRIFKLKVEPQLTRSGYQVKSDTLSNALDNLIKNTHETNRKNCINSEPRSTTNQQHQGF